MHRVRHVGLALLVAVASVAAAGTVRTKLRRPPGNLQIRIDPFTVTPPETEVCEAVSVPIKKKIDVDEITVRLPEGQDYTSHHFAMFLADKDAPDLPRTPEKRVGCVGAGGAIVSPILAFVQRPGGQSIHFPKGVAVGLDPSQVLLLNPHFVNVGPDPVTLDVAVNFHKARKKHVQHHARSFQLGTLRIDVPPGETRASTAEWRTPFAMNLVWLSTHSHKHTTSVDIELLRGSAPPASPPLIETRSYSEPAFQYYDVGQLRLEAGDGLRWTCTYRNDTPETLTFGVSAEDEMCFAVGFFVPDNDTAPMPRVPGCFGSGLGLVCPAN